MALCSFLRRVSVALILVLLLGGGAGGPIASSAQPAGIDTSGVTPPRARTLFVRGMTQSYLEDYEEAVALFEKALDLAPEEPAILIALAEAEAARGNEPSALYYARQARNRAGEQPYYHRQLAEMLREAGRPQEALATYRTLLDSFPNNRQGRLALARLQAELQQPTDALRTYETLVDSSDRPRQPQVYREMLTLYRTVGDTEGQERVLNTLLDLQGSVPRYHRLLARLYLEQDRYKEALPHFEALLRKTPPSPQLLSRLKMLYDRTGQPEKAEALWDSFDAKKTSPDQLVTRARSTYKDASRSPDSSTVATAAHLLEKALERDSTHVDALTLLGRIRYESGDYARAAQLLDRATDENPRSPERWETAASAHLKANRPQRARRVAEDGLLLFPGRPALLRTLAFAHLRLGNNEAAQSHFRDALTKIEEAAAPDRAALHAGRGLALDRMDNHREADQAYERALDLNPDQPEALRNYAFSLAQRETNLDRALQLAQRAVENAPSAPEALSTLGWVYFRRGAISKAKSTFERALEREPVPAAVYERFGDLHRALGNDALAQRYWKEALERDPDRDALKKKLETRPKS